MNVLLSFYRQQLFVVVAATLHMITYQTEQQAAERIQLKNLIKGKQCVMYVGTDWLYVVLLTQGFWMFTINPQRCPDT